MAKRRATISKKGVTGVLSMMFLIMFSSLAVAMAVTSKGNLRAAETHLLVSRAQSAVDTGLQIAESRMNEAAARLIVAKGEIDPPYALELWNGTYSLSPTVTILPAADGRVEPNSPVGLADILRMQHNADAEAEPITAITLATAPAGWVRADPVAIERNGDGEAVNCVQIDYGPPDAQGRVLVVATGYDWDWLRGRWVNRSAQQFFTIAKTVSHAIISPSRVMLGRNADITGPLGIRYNSASLDTLDGPPLVSESDFEGMVSGLDAKLGAFHTAVIADDVDGDNRLRVVHATESRSLAALNARDFNSDSAADNAFNDYTRDGAIDEFDIFLKHFDTVQGDAQKKVVLSSALKTGTPSAALTSEFTLDDSLGVLIDGANPDRNGNGRYNGRLYNGTWDWASFPDNNGDGARDVQDIDWDDIALGYRDGALDYKDQYAKINGAVYFRAARTAWESSRDEYGVLIADYQKLVEGTIMPEKGEAPVKFQATDAEVPDFTDESFADAAELMGEFSQGNGVQTDNFNTKVAPQLNGEFISESTPYGSPTPADWYRRPVYRNLVFRNTTVPRGTNALFVACTFIGVTRIETWTDNTHASWGFYGEEQRNTTTGALTPKYPPPPAESPAALDTSYSTPGAPGYAALPAPLYVDLNRDGNASEQCTNTKLVSNNLRFHDCIFIGGIVADKPRIFTHVRNKLQFTGATKFVDQHPTEPDNPAYRLTDAERVVTHKSSMMLPHYSVDIGTNNSPATQDIHLHGAVIAGVLDVRGNADIIGALLMTFKPLYGQAPLAVYGTPAGNPRGFNVTLGYFGPDQGDAEGISLLSMTDLDANGVKDVGWDSARASNGTLVAVGTSPALESWYDGIPDTDATAGTHIRRPIPFNGFGKITLTLDKELVLPDGLAAPISIKPVRTTYLEGRVAYD